MFSCSCGARTVAEESLAEIDAFATRQPKRREIKVGRRGYLAVADGRRAFVPAFEVRAVDSTAAGEAFNGALTSGAA